MLEIYGYGTNTGTRAVASSGHAHSEDDIRYVRWGEGTTTVASDFTTYAPERPVRISAHDLTARRTLIRVVKRG